MKTILSILDKRGPELIWWLSFLAIFAICYTMLVIKRDIDLQPLLVIPILVASWYGSSKAGASLALLTAILLFAVKWFSGAFHVSAPTAVIDAAIALFVYLFIGVIVTNFKKVHKVEVVAADTDTLTGVNSSRSFYAELANEILRAKRYDHIFSLAYIDVDNFKRINDSLGHSVGDKLLIELSRCLQDALRATDITARIGGDEFVCLLPEAGESEAKTAMLKAEKELQKSMKRHGWDVSFSIGVVTFKKLPDDVREAVKLADELMYEVKNNKKNNIAYRVWDGTDRM